MNANLPIMVASHTANAAYSGGQLFAANNGGLVAGNAAQFQQYKALAHQNVQQPKGIPMSTRRIVQVFIADPNENISLEDCLLFKGEEKLTDATDQELFFELDIKDLLEKHNEKRTKIIDKKVKDRKEFLEPAKVRDLKMVVVTVASL